MRGMGIDGSCFFFQAEDGIRDYDVTGVQTCALPISNLVSCLVKATRKIGFDKDRARDLQRFFCNETIAAKPRQHVMDGLFGFAEHLGVGSKKLQWDLTIPESASIFADNHIQKGKINCVISPCSSQIGRASCRERV